MKSIIYQNNKITEINRVSISYKIKQKHIKKALTILKKNEQITIRPKLVAAATASSSNTRACAHTTPSSNTNEMVPWLKVSVSGDYTP